MKEYISPTVEEFSVQAADIITASGDGIVAPQDSSIASQIIETEWKDSWNSSWN